jgi:hypothetical protein
LQRNRVQQHAVYRDIGYHSQRAIVRLEQFVRAFGRL